MARFLEKNYKDFLGLMGKSVANIILTPCRFFRKMRRFGMLQVHCRELDQTVLGRLE